MRTTGRRSFVLYILLVVCVAGSVWLTVCFFTNGKQWASQSYNKHLSVTALGEIKDRHGATLAETVDGVRSYSDDEAMRRALLHTVGDSGGYITTSVQNTMRAKLSGYNPITGVGNTIFNQIGKNVELTVSADVSLAAYQALGGKDGAVLVYNYKTGEVICKVSAPTFDSANVPDDLLSDETGKYEGVLLDNTLVSSYTPGSIFKLVTQAAAMDEWSDWATREYNCEGSITIGGNSITCLGVHGIQNAYGAMGYSCNVYYALLANDLGGVKLQEKAEQLGFNGSLTFDDVACRASSIDLSGADANQVAWAGIGQYTLLANPYHMLTLMGAIANGGSYTEPHLTDSMDLLSGITSGKRAYMSASQASSLTELMRHTVENYYQDSMFPEGMEVCAKTGTGEVGGDQQPNCWMVGFSKSEKQPYAFVVIVEEGTGGIETAGAVASQVMNAVAQNVQ